jgi:hypothetical protein
MPRPAYITCSLSGAIDQINHSVSCFSLLEMVQFSRVQLPREGQPLPVVKPLTIRVVATWLREENDGLEQIFQGQLVLRLPNRQEEIPLVDFGNFSFPEPVHRLIVAEVGIPDMAAGLMFVECRIRRAGEDNWMASQSYPILATEVQTHELQAEQPADT